MASRGTYDNLNQQLKESRLEVRDANIHVVFQLAALLLVIPQFHRPRARALPRLNADASRLTSMCHLAHPLQLCGTLFFLLLQQQVVFNQTFRLVQQQPC